MSKDPTPSSLRLPPELLSRADVLLPLIAQDAELRTFGRVSRSSVLRLAVLRGLEALETQYRKP